MVANQSGIYIGGAAEYSAWSAFAMMAFTSGPTIPIPPTPDFGSGSENAGMREVGFIDGINSSINLS